MCPFLVHMKQFLSEWLWTEFDWNNLFKKYPFIVFLIDLKVICIFLFSAFDFLHFLEKGILANKDYCVISFLDYLGLKKIVLWTVIGLIYCYFCTNSNFIYSIILIALVYKFMYHILICYKDWNSVSKA